MGTRFPGEPRLDEMLADSVMRAVMGRDGVTEGQIREIVSAYRKSGRFTGRGARAASDQMESPVAIHLSDKAALLIEK